MKLFSLELILLLALLLPAYFLVPRRAGWVVLLVGSLLFYLGGGWLNFFVMAALCLVTFGCGRLLGGAVTRRDATLAAHREEWDRAQRSAFRKDADRRQHLLLTAGISFLLGLLFFTKYLPLWAAGVLPTQLTDILWPLGISYVTLSAISYLVDVSRGKQTAQRNIARFALFIFYFPQMWQGPINRYSELAPALCAPHPFEGRRAAEGGVRALWGCFKKLVVADTVAVAVLSVSEDAVGLGGSGVWLLILLYSIQIYADFTGGMDIALGLSHILGIDLYENFDRPFGATSIGDYWRRWHRSMSRFFTDYVFYPLSTGRVCQWLSSLCRRLFGARVGGRIPLYLATLITWALTGLWHGPGLNFLAWGLCNGVLMLLWQGLSNGARRRRGRGEAPRHPRARGALGWAVTLGSVSLFRTLDVYGDAGLTFSLWGRALLPSAMAGLADPTTWSALGLELSRWVVVIVGGALMWAVSRLTPRVGEERPTPAAGLAARPFLCAVVCAFLVVAVLVFGNYGQGFDAMDFIYGRY